jgi:molecular chaperone GrpE
MSTWKTVEAHVDGREARQNPEAADVRAAAEASGHESTEQAEDLPPLDEAGALQVERDRLRAEVQELQDERDRLKDRHLRLAAEYDNFRKRTAREWEEQRKRASAEVLRQVLDIADNLERALQVQPEDAEGLQKGVELIHQQLQAFLGRCGIERMEVKGTPFDPNRHDAVLLVDSEEVESQHVVDVVQSGYTLHGEVLRPARVAVSR